MTRTTFSVLILTFIFIFNSYSQFPEDALRYSSSGIGVGARSLGLGMAYSGISNDYSAIYWNPAGLGLIEMSEFSMGFNHLSLNNKSTFYNNDKSFSNSRTKLNNFGVAYPFPTTTGSLVFAAGYQRTTDYSSALSFSGFNPVSSIINYYAPHGRSTEKKPRGNLAWELYLADVDSLSPNSYAFYSPIQDSVTQSGKILEGGGMNNWSVGMAVEAAKDLFIGGSLNLMSGSYTWQRNYVEQDLHDIYNVARYPFDFKSLFIDQTIDASISGFSAKFGFLYNYTDRMRFGITFKTPSWLTVEETFTSEGESFFDNGDNYNYPSGGSSKDKTKYDIVSPFVFGCGITYMFDDLLVTGEIEYTDWTQMEFQNATDELIRFNTDIKEIFRETLNLKGGFEYEFSRTGARVRGGFAYLPSPYDGDPASFARKYITAGAGFIVQNSVAIDLGYAYGFWDTFHVNYDKTSRTNESIKTHNIIATLTYRF